jgi:preprotein translocase subunit SecE
MKALTRIATFISETGNELRKTNWPTRKDLKRSASVVLTGAAFIGFYVAVVDFSLFQVVNLLIDMVR